MKPLGILGKRENRQMSLSSQSVQDDLNVSQGYKGKQGLVWWGMIFKPCGRQSRFESGT